MFEMKLCLRSCRYLSTTVAKVVAKQRNLCDEQRNALTGQLNKIAGKTFYLETFGCQMNVSDSEIVNRVLVDAGLTRTDAVEAADVILTNTCAVRENAENKVWQRLKYFNSLKQKRRIENKKADHITVGVLGCMAERISTKILDDSCANFTCGPDSYRDLPHLLVSSSITSQKAASTQLSLEETYADIEPVRKASSTEAFVSIMRGCNNMCSFCVVPFTRGRERSRELASIVNEIKRLSDDGVKEVCLLGQNVNSYHDLSLSSKEKYPMNAYISTPGFKNMYRARDGPGPRFSELLDEISLIDPEMRIRFTSPHPKDFPLEVLQLIKDRPNICSAIHLPAQSGSTTTLTRMRRGYSRESYLDLIERTRSTIPGVSISTDFISGFCGETEDEHQDTLSLIELVKYDQAYMYAYSLRDKTHAAHNFSDDVPDEIKQRRLREVIETFRKVVQTKNTSEVLDKFVLVLVDGLATKSTLTSPRLSGRSDTNKRVTFDMHPVPDLSPSSDQIPSFADFLLHVSSFPTQNIPQQGEYVIVKINEVRGHVLRGNAICKSSIVHFKELSLLYSDELQIGFQ